MSIVIRVLKVSQREKHRVLKSEKREPVKETEK